MTSHRVLWLIGLLGVGACDWVDFGGEDDDDDTADGDADGNADADADADGDADTDADGDADADPCDAMACDVAPDPICLDAERLRTFVVPGLCRDGACQFSTSDADCGAVGCCADHCCGVVPSNAGALGQIEAGGRDIQIRDATFDTALDCEAGSILGDCARVVQADAPDVCVCRVADLELGSLAVTGDAALAILAAGPVTIDGTASVAGEGGARGPGATFEYLATGWAGGSYSTVGGEGNAAAVWGTEALEPLAGGMDGQDSCGAVGGGAGGVLLITSAVSISVTGTLDAGGGRGGGGRAAGCGSYWDGGGGGSGGGILLEAPSVTMDGTAAANGGGGGGAGGSGEGEGGAGSDASVTLDHASGGWSNDGGGCALYGYTSGGGGGSGAAGGSNGFEGGSYDSVTGCLGEDNYVGDGGGGGGEGRIRVNSTEPCDCDGLFSPAATFGAVLLE